MRNRRKPFVRRFRRLFRHSRGSRAYDAACAAYGGTALSPASATAITQTLYLIGQAMSFRFRPRRKYPLRDWGRVDASGDTRSGVARIQAAGRFAALFRGDHGFIARREYVMLGSISSAANCRWQMILHHHAFGPPINLPRWEQNRRMRLATRGPWSSIGTRGLTRVSILRHLGRWPVLRSRCEKGVPELVVISLVLVVEEGPVLRKISMEPCRWMIC